MHLGRRYIEHFSEREHTPVRTNFFLGYLISFVVNCLFSERVFVEFFFFFFWILHTLAWAWHTWCCSFRQHSHGGDAWSHYTRVIDQPHGYEEGGYICFTLRFPFVLMSFYDGSLIRGLDYDGVWLANSSDS
jgi:hypothetical protein